MATLTGPTRRVPRAPTTTTGSPSAKINDATITLTKPIERKGRRSYVDDAEQEADAATTSM